MDTIKCARGSMMIPKRQKRTERLLVQIKAEVHFSPSTVGGAEAEVRRVSALFALGVLVECASIAAVVARIAPFDWVVELPGAVKAAPDDVDLRTLDPG